jgi:hypothetical protein
LFSNSTLDCLVSLLFPPPDGKTAVSQQLRAAKFVYIKAPPAASSLSPAFRGPYAVHKRSEKFYIVKIGQRYEAVSLDRLKPHVGGTAKPAEPPKRGRPPGRKK